jgi:serine O-acetyltransferase
MEDIIKEDLYRYVPKQFKKKYLLRGFRSQGFRYMFLKRKLDNKKYGSISWLILKIIIRHYTYKYGFQIGGKIGKGFFIGHFGTIVVSEEAIIGNNCNIAHGVTIGNTRRGDKAGAPIIGDEVWIGANAIIVGKIIIGNNVLIAPGAFVNFDVPNNSIVIGNPGTIKYSEKATESYINNKVI